MPGELEGAETTHIIPTQDVIKPQDKIKRLPMLSQAGRNVADRIGRMVFKFDCSLFKKDAPPEIRENLPSLLEEFTSGYYEGQRWLLEQIPMKYPRLRTFFDPESRTIAQGTAHDDRPPEVHVNIRGLFDTMEDITKNGSSTPFPDINTLN